MMRDYTVACCFTDLKTDTKYFVVSVDDESTVDDNITSMLISVDVNTDRNERQITVLSTPIALWDEDFLSAASLYAAVEEGFENEFI